MKLKSHITTYMGMVLDPMNLQQDDILISDIGHALALCNRFAGHTKEPYSVAQHSVYVSRLCPLFPLKALLHDASEAYLGDMTKWVKMTDACAGYREAENRAQQAIEKKFDVIFSDIEEEQAIREIEFADRLMVRVEAYHFFGSDMGLFINNHPDYKIPTTDELDTVGPLECWPWWKAETEFRIRFKELMEGRSY